MRRLSLSIGLVALALGACRPAMPPQTPTDEALPAGDAVFSQRGAAFGIRRSVVADQYFWLRAKALEGEAPAAFADALAAMQELRSDLGADAASWEDLEVPLGVVSRASELVAAYGALAERRDTGEKVVALRAGAVRLARAMEATEDAFRRGPYASHAAGIQQAAKELLASVGPKEAAIVDAFESELGVSMGGASIVVTLVADAPYQGAFAADERGKVTATFVRVRGLEGLALAEVVLGEILHAVDERSVREKSTATNLIRAALLRHGLEANDPTVEMVIATVLQAEAASLVQRFVSATHRPLGESGLHDLFPPAAGIATAWRRHIEGASIEATAEVIAALAAPDGSDAPDAPPTGL